jgi:succinate dehydrogenase/fumarate reductase-like Fe-S protein
LVAERRRFGGMLAVYARIQKILSYYEKYKQLFLNDFRHDLKMKNNFEKIECGFCAGYCQSKWKDPHHEFSKPSFHSWPDEHPGIAAQGV